MGNYELAVQGTTLHLCVVVKTLPNSYLFLIFQESFEAASAESSASFSSLMLDDVFFIVKKCVRRAMSSQSIDGVCAVANNACTILETDFCGLLQTQLRMGFPSGYLDLTMNVIQTSFQQGYKMAAAQATGDSDKQKAVFLVSLCIKSN